MAKTPKYSQDYLLDAIKRAMEETQRKGNYDTHYRLSQIYQFLPEYPVMAVLEAEYLQVDKELVSMIAKGFDVKPFR
jgi:hypothetical protein